MKEIITSIRKARIAHKKWVAYAIATIDQITIEEKFTPKDETSSLFGQWYSKNQWGLSKYNEYQEIRELYATVHCIYQEILVLIKMEKKPSLMDKLVGSSCQYSKKDLARIKHKYAQFEKFSNKILYNLRAIETLVTRKIKTLESSTTYLHNENSLSAA